MTFSGLVCLGPATFAGEISLLQIWDHVLSTGTISDLYSAGVRGQDITEEEGLLLDWAWSLYSAGPGVSRYKITDLFSSGFVIVLHLFIGRL